MWVKGINKYANTYILKRFDTVMLIDPAFDIYAIKELIKGYRVAGILLTHGHARHSDLIGNFNCPVYLHRNDYNLFISDDLCGYNKLGKKRDYNLNQIFIKFVDDQTKIPFLDKNILVIHTPGHTKGSVCYLFEDRLYTGDTLLEDKHGKVSQPEGSLTQIRNSIKKLYKVFSDQIDVYPGHGNPTSLGKIKEKSSVIQNILKTKANS